MNQDTRDEHLMATAQPPDAETLPLFTGEQWVKLLCLRRRYGQGQDMWDIHELARLSFLRWLITTGHVDL